MKNELKCNNLIETVVYKIVCSFYVFAGRFIFDWLNDIKIELTYNRATLSCNKRT